MAPVRNFFGTDGIRGRFGDEPISIETFIKLGNAIGETLTTASNRRIVIGRDTRESGTVLEHALTQGLEAAGAEVMLLGVMPTPVIAYLTQALEAVAGLVISASHNPHYDNGLKIFSHQGFKLADEHEAAIEQCLGQMILPETTNLQAKKIKDAEALYLQHCQATISKDLDLTGLKIVLDCAHGATYHLAPRIFTSLGAEVHTIGTEPNGVNINDKVGSTHPEQLQQTVVAEQADLGIAFDGDGDRVMMVDNRGNVVDGDQLLYLIAKQGLANGSLSGGIVGTLMTNLALELACKKLGIAFARAKVGDRYVLEMLQANGWQLGGENSGHVIDLRVSTTGDGIASALQVLSSLRASGESLASVLDDMPLFPQVLINVPIAQKPANLELPAINQAISEAESQLGDKGRVLLRPSGTEPLVRVMVEGEDEALVGQVCQTLADKVATALQ
ncbi:MAG: phosphoglucosamine mutase [Legionellales bacterium]|nr:phosphoglucosamine mutase [Legionellales bacterium]|tara:strand:+ start:961 stop:2298 length:1338 start_codon:yes stop_codon:yes gene_type:complete